ncbi:MAG: hypothetical protein AAGA67_01635 [Cyanobacteria bacterium P01_F01_bin.153]
MKVENFNGLKTRTYWLLVVEDSDIYFERLNGLFEQTSIYVVPPTATDLPRRFVVRRAESVDNALVQLRDDSTEFDAVLLSGHVSSGDRDDAIGVLSHYAGAAPLLLLTTLGESDESIRHGLEQGAVAHLLIEKIHHEGSEFLSNAVLDAIAIRAGGLAEGASNLDRFIEFARNLDAIQRSALILIWTLIVLVGEPSIKQGKLTAGIEDYTIPALLSGGVTIWGINERLASWRDRRITKNRGRL